MTAWPGSTSIIGPEMISLGLSLAHLAMADNDPDVRDALAALSASGERLRDLVGQLPDSPDTDGHFPAWFDPDMPPRDIRSALEVLAELEEVMLANERSTGALLRKMGSSELLGMPSDTGTIQAIRQLYLQIFPKMRPFVRELRLELVLIAGKRARSVGVDLLPDDLDLFKTEFRTAAFADTLGWQEMAHLAASPANAKRLATAIAASAQEKSEEITYAPASVP